jgi:hypothetical protein
MIYPCCCKIQRYFFLCQIWTFNLLFMGLAGIQVGYGILTMRMLGFPQGKQKRSTIHPCCKIQRYIFLGQIWTFNLLFFMGLARILE